MREGWYLGRVPVYVLGAVGAEHVIVVEQEFVARAQQDDAFAMPAYLRPLKDIFDRERLPMTALVPEDLVKALLARADLVEVIGEAVELQPAGPQMQGLCPFHAEQTPSFLVSREQGVFYCLGCHASGNVIKFVMRHKGVPFADAVYALAARYGLEASP